MKQKMVSWIIGIRVECPYCGFPRFYQGKYKTGDKIMCKTGKACGKTFVLR